MLRTPAFSVADYSEINFRCCLEDPFFRSAIQLASSSLYAKLEKHQFKFEELDVRTRASLRKYFNRMCFRPTPFGLFSSFTPTRWDSSTGPITLPGRGEAVFKADLRETVGSAASSLVCLDDITFYPNRTIYQVGLSWRYLVRMAGENFGDEHAIQSLRCDRFLKNLFEFCDSGKKGFEIIEYLLDFFEDPMALQYFWTEALDAQLLVSELTPNIVGEDYSNRVSRCSRLMGGNVPGNDETLANKASSTACAGEVYSVYRRISTAGALDVRHQESLLQALQCLDKLTRAEEPPILTMFKSKFISKFENQEVPLLAALDPEIGVGYGQMEQGIMDNDLCSDIFNAAKDCESSVSWGSVQTLLVSKWTAGFNRNPTDPIILFDEDLASLQDPCSVGQPGFSVMFRILQSGRVFIEQAGGITATALHGRFTPFDKSVLSGVRQIAEIEMARNPQVIFAEIGYYNHEHAANINVREHLFDYEIPILTHSTLPFDKQIPLNDLLVSVVDDQIVLRSARFNQPVIPRHSSAYNYNRSELSVFRFLCDLQYQGAKSNLGISMKTLFPNLPFYPRVEYKNAILSRATWILEKRDIEGAVTNVKDFRQFAADRNLPRFVALSSNDHQLVFDLDCDDGIGFLMECVKRSSRTELVEFFMPGNTVTDNSEGVYVNQFIASLYNENEVYFDKRAYGHKERKGRKIKRVFSPGEEWIYLKVYCHEAVSDEILTQYIEPVVRSLRRDGVIDQWFFLRYKDPDSHLRLRVRKASSQNSFDIQGRFYSKLQPLLTRGSVSSVITDSYKREIERYGSEVIEEVEGFFGTSSDLVMKAMKQGNQVPEWRIIGAIQAADLILTSFLELPEKRVELLKLIFESMREEFDEGRHLKVKLDMKFRSYRQLIETTPTSNKAASRKLQSTVDRVKTKCSHWPTDRQFKLIGDLMHMHMNRIFHTEQRKQEFVIYYLLYKYYKGISHRPICGLSGSGLRQYDS